MDDEQDDIFPDLEGTFETAELESALLSSTDHVQEAIGEGQQRKSHWRIAFRRVQYGTYLGDPACLIVVEGKFHAEDRRRHRFTWAKISMTFSSQTAGQPIEIKEMLPERAYGITVPEASSSSWTLRGKASATMPGIPATVDILDVSRQTTKHYRIDRIAGMQGSTRGFPTANQAVWTIEEANQEGIPWRIPSLVVLIRYPAGCTFTASFAIDVKIGFSINPARWPMFAKALQPIEFNETKKLIKKGEEEFESNFTNLDLSKLTTLDFSGDR